MTGFGPPTITKITKLMESPGPRQSSGGSRRLMLFASNVGPHCTVDTWRAVITDCTGSTKAHLRQVKADPAITLAREGPLRAQGSGSIFLGIVNALDSSGGSA